MVLIYIFLPGTGGIIKRIRDRVGTENPVYLSIDIDSIDPACMWPTPDDLGC